MKLRNKSIVALAVMTGLVSSAVYAKDPPAPETKQLEVKIANLVQKIVKLKTDRPPDMDAQIRDQFNVPGQNPDLFLLALLPYENFVTLLEEARVDKQVTASDPNAGGASLVSKGSVPSIIGIAVENGALNRVINGTLMTFTGSPVGIIKALGDKGFISSYDDDGPVTRRLRDLGFSFTVDTSRGNQPGTFTGDLNQLASYSLKYSFINQRDPRHPSYRKKWSNIIGTYGHDITKETSTFTRIMRTEPLYVDFFKAAQDQLISATTGDVEGIVREALVNYRRIPMPSELAQLVNRYGTAVRGYLEKRGHILEEAANGSILTFEYTNSRFVTDPDLSNFKLIYENSFNGRAELTANASFTIFNKRPLMPNIDRIRDYQAAVQLDTPLSNPAVAGAWVFSVSYKLQHLMDDMASSATGDKGGDIHLLQSKLTIPIKGTGFKLPLSVTWANRTDLIKEKFVRGNFGLTFDLDTLFSKLRP